MGKSFCITGFGRSGTKWLAEMMDRSKTWTVNHEPDSRVDLRWIQQRFNVGSSAGNYGEVNSNCLMALPALEVDYKSVILRCPRQLLVSCVRKGHQFNDILLSHINNTLSLMDALIESGKVEPISFRDMVGKPGYIEGVMHKAGVTDVSLFGPDLENKINSSEGKLKWGKLGNDEKDRASSVFNWFSSKYSLLLETASG